jgi:hypothetical protein
VRRPESENFALAKLHPWHLRPRTMCANSHGWDKVSPMAASASAVAVAVEGEDVFGDSRTEPL